jgi:hypothetical protein
MIWENLELLTVRRCQNSNIWPAVIENARLKLKVVPDIKEEERKK